MWVIFYALSVRNVCTKFKVARYSCFVYLSLSSLNRLETFPRSNFSDHENKSSDQINFCRIVFEIYIPFHLKQLIYSLKLKKYLNSIRVFS